MAQLSSISSHAPPRNGVGILFGLVFFICSVLAVYALRIVSVQIGISDKMDNIVSTKRFPHNSLPLRTTYTGFTPIDSLLSFLVASFMNGASGWDEGFWVFLIYFLISFFPIVTVWAVESCRERNTSVLLRMTFIYALFYQTVGGAIIIPLYYLSYTYVTSNNMYWSKPRDVPLPYAKALLPALLIGYLIPTVLMFLPYNTPDMWTTQAMVALWQPSPWFVDILIWLLSTFYSLSGDGRPEQVKNNDQSKTFTQTQNRDIPHLSRTYLSVFLVAAACHIGVVYLCLFSPNSHHRFQYLFIPSMTGPAEAVSDDDLTLVKGIFTIFQFDFWIIFGSSVLWAAMAIWDLKRVGIADKEPSLGLWGVMLIAGCVLVGPGATVMAVWYWREMCLVRWQQQQQDAKRTN